MAKPLTTKAVLTLKPRAKPYEVRDPALTGAYITVHPSGALSYVLRYRLNTAKKKLTIGQFDPVTGLAEVRAKAHAALADLAKARRDPSAIDPAAAKTQARREAREAEQAAKQERHDSVEHAVASFAKRHLATLRTGADVHRALEREFVGRFRGRRLAEITRADIHELLDTIADRGAPVQAARVKSYIGKLYRWARSRGLVEHNPVEQIERVSVETQRDRVLDDVELALVWKAADSFGFPFGAVTQMLVLSGQRLGEIAGMRWSEIDFGKRVWRLPPERVKNKRPHELPLTPQMLAILESLPRVVDRDFVFSTTFGSRATASSGFSRFKHNLDNAIARLNDGAPIPAWRLHDIRRTTASGMAALGVNLPVIEKVLNHVSGSFGGIVSVYQRHSFADEKRAALEKWNAHVERIVSGASEGEKVVPLRRRDTP